MPTGKEAMREWRKNNPEKDRENKLRAAEKQKQKRMLENKSRPPRPTLTRTGSAPSRKYNPELIEEITISGDSWLVFNLKSKAFGNWFNLKVSAKSKVQGKANYWISHNGERFAKSPMLASLQNYRPELLEKIDRLMKAFSEKNQTEPSEKNQLTENQVKEISVGDTMFFHGATSRDDKEVQRMKMKIYRAGLKWSIKKQKDGVLVSCIG